ncbi:MAG: polyprenyl synthetase family protein [Anaerolineae bacterium]
MTPIEQILGRYTPAIEQTIQDALVDASPFVAGVIRYHFGWANQNFEPARSESGKMLRPVLCLLVFEELAGSYQAALPAAAAVEMIHNFSLIHDDIEDNDAERRGRPTAWSVWGKPLAINVGDYLYTLAFQMLTRLDESRFSAATLLAVQRMMTNACLTLTLGQDLDLRFEQLPLVTSAMYLDMVAKKTGALLEASILCGAMLGTSNRQTIDYYHQFAANIGIAFQIQDDILGIWGDSSQTGKSVDNDLRRKKKTLPVLHTLNHIDGAQGEELKSLYLSAEPLTDPQVAFVRRCLEQADALPFARQAADGYIEQAYAALNNIKASNRGQTSLELIASYLINRER